MTRFLPLLLLAALVAGIIPWCMTDTAKAADGQKIATTRLHIDGMSCGACATAVRVVLRKTTGVVSADVSYEEKRAVVTYDARKTTPARIADAITTALPYKVRVEGPSR